VNHLKLDYTELGVFLFFFTIVTGVGFFASRWRRGDMDELDEWGLAGRRFGTLITWFLVGGDFYTAYTVIAVPALVFAVGALGFFALPYTIIVYPFVFLTMPRLWAVSSKHGYITPSDFVRGRYGSHWLALAVALTGILSTMPYIALQLVGIEVVLAQMGLTGSSTFVNDLPVIVAFIILALYTYSSGLRAPALIALVKDVMIYIMVLAAVIYVPIKLGGYAHIFAAAGAALSLNTPKGFIILQHQNYAAYATLALGSALAAFMYPHMITSVLSSSSGRVIKRNAVLLPAYTFLLGLIALLGYMAITAGIHPKSPNFVVPGLFQSIFPSWFAGFCFAAIAIAALVPAAIMSIAAANIYTRNIYREYINPSATPKQESQNAKLASLVVKFGALAFVLFFPIKYAINLQLLGGIWILQTFPSLVFGLWRRRFHHKALLIGWAAGMIAGTWMTLALKLKSTVYPVMIGGKTYPIFAGLLALLLNLFLCQLFTWAFDAMGMQRGADQTSISDYEETESEQPA
jgi:SSS family solute:Na+ symporter